MRPLLQRASRSIFSSAVLGIALQSSKPSVHGFIRTAANAPAICVPCQLRAASMNRPGPLDLLRSRILATGPTRHFSTSGICCDKENPSEPSVPKESPQLRPALQDQELASIKSTKPNTLHKVEDTIARVPAEDLPSHRDGQRWRLNKRLAEFMDDMLPKLAIVTQKVNTYTGTDYSGIEALRKEIKDQEQLVKARRLAIDEAKHALDAAHAQQGSSQKEVVALLERKHSWSAHDLERYMSLIRSEHVNDQAVREAKEAVHNAEAALEEARSHLEKRERAQYHEEQIWSDTIRRNSTWVTFGLMGLNIFLLLASLVAIEPWRRSKMVNEIKRTLDAQRPASIEPAASPQRLPPIEAPIEAPIDAVVEPAGRPLEDLKPTQPALQFSPEVEPVRAVELPVDVYEPAVDITSPGAAPLTPELVDPQETINIPEEVRKNTTPKSWDAKIRAAARDLVSDETISVRRKDCTAAIFSAATVGAIVSGAVITLLRST
ncbi:hypothetical protein K504DRAFT_491584 [Pleomassaria siparia CBS 279.74]|uniref:Sensitive to high expression protein 9, mitochondrial n=1 Tax=Pleomassaria siparia CBS 279.74 TaxID=1314801 RepID=A0A6G1K7U3_9PLEO|nr:hypothetical protein K504DRAFT_491584 [Pleomassaria siparia CBS 279.74]